MKITKNMIIYMMFSIRIPIEISKQLNNHVACPVEL